MGMDRREEPSTYEFVLRLRCASPADFARSRPHTAHSPHPSMRVRAFPLAPPSAFSTGLLRLIALVLIVASAVGALAVFREAAGASRWLSVLVLVPTVLPCWLLYRLARGLPTMRVELDDDGLRLVAPLYGRHLPWADLDLPAARLASLDDEPGLRTLLTHQRRRAAGRARRLVSPPLVQARPPRRHRPARGGRAHAALSAAREPGRARSLPGRAARRRACMSVRRRCRRCGRRRRRGRGGCRRARRASGRAWR